MKEHRARVYWSAEHQDRGLPEVSSAIDPAWLSGAELGVGDGWSLACEFDPPPSSQGSPSIAKVRFMMDEAPHSALVPGAKLELFERATGKFAVVEILD